MGCSRGYNRTGSTKMRAEDIVAQSIRERPWVYPCGHPATGSAGCDGCADERESQARKNAEFRLAFENFFPEARRFGPKPRVGLLRRLVRRVRHEHD